MGRRPMINIAKFERKKVHTSNKESSSAWRNKGKQRIFVDTWRDGRTFTAVEHWLKSELTIVGEVRSYDHLTSLPSSILNGDGGRYSAKINEELTVVADNKLLKIGIYEVDDNWKLFVTYPEDSEAESEGDDDDDAISNTMKDDDEIKSVDMGEMLEEGEIGNESESARIHMNHSLMMILR
ncbi:unnamed protein product [Lactuca saligna]|uniref:Uncharacterized protein n=1 Tax=Lactuca saligna TaxID=75948 RepID=A0AA35YRI7_LACSI|nr:unnamed protein product [Lactuca saligna]